MKAFFVVLLLVQSAVGAGLKWEGTMQRIEVGPGEKSVRREFPYRNTGTTQVRIEKVGGGCACCTGAYATKKKLAPGEGGAVVVKVDVSKLPLPLAKPVTVTTNDGQTTVLMVQVFAKP